MKSTYLHWDQPPVKPEFYDNPNIREAISTIVIIIASILFVASLSLLVFLFLTNGSINAMIFISVTSVAILPPILLAKSNYIIPAIVWLSETVYIVILIEMFIPVVKISESFYYFFIPSVLLMIFLELKKSLPIILFNWTIDIILRYYQGTPILKLVVIYGLFNVLAITIVFVLLQIVNILSTEYSILQQQESMKRLNEARFTELGIFTARIVHDLNNITTSLQLNKDVLDLDKLDLSQPLKDYIKTTDASIESINQLIQSLLEFSKQQSVEKKAVTVSQLIERLLPIFYFFLSPSSDLIFIDNSTSSDIEIAPVELQQILLNIIKNAGEAIDENGQIKIILENVEEDNIQYLMIAIVDDGYGISQKNLEKIFNFNFTTKTEGHGIGLSTVKLIVEKNNGSFAVICFFN